MIDGVIVRQWFRCFQMSNHYWVKMMHCTPSLIDKVIVINIEVVWLCNYRV